MSKWREVRFKDVIEFNPKVKLEKNKMYPVIGIADIDERKFNVYENEKLKYTGQGSSKFESGDVLFSRITPCLENRKIARVFLDSDDRGFGSTELFVFRGKKNSTMTEFVSYLAQTDIIVLPAINSMSGASGRQRADRYFIEKLKIQIPDLKTQEKIADILSTYDELIEINNRRIEILETIAEEIYKEWFIRMRFPGHENVKFEKGISEGWEVKRVSEIINIADGTHDTPKKVDKGVPLVTGRNILEGTIDFNSTYNISYEDYEKINIRSAIFENDILYSNIGTIGTMAIVGKDNKYSVKNLIILKTSEYKHYEYLYLLFRNGSSQDYFESVASGASQKFISLTEMRKYKILLPNIDILDKFKFIVGEIFNKIRVLQLQNQNLIKQRDLLLPRLMNGTIEVK